MIRQDAFVRADTIGLLWYDLPTLKTIFEKFAELDYWHTQTERFRLLDIINHKISITHAA